MVRVNLRPTRCAVWGLGCGVGDTLLLASTLTFSSRADAACSLLANRSWAACSLSSFAFSSAANCKDVLAFRCLEFGGWENSLAFLLQVCPAATGAWSLGLMVRERLVFKTHRPLHYSTLGSRVIIKQQVWEGTHFGFLLGFGFLLSCRRSLLALGESILGCPLAFLLRFLQRRELP